ncbi:MAG: cytochrome ubiquinol oxidase subunit I [Myxococcaceae bacterium]|nr:cytochrome ubiquinol oxidase subunit I [Myxococcaceae bacterium]MBH2006223.1 cytochrome ubiquinol oxidase subunit I [Myxococcaceae bacterium]
MGLSLGFHIIFAICGIGMPLLMCIAEWVYLRTNNLLYLTLAKRWSQGTAIMFAVGAVSGTVLSFELGLLWPTFMKFAGPVIGMPFSLEGFAFFLEAIFLGIYLYGWEKISTRAHWLTGVMVLISGTSSAILVVAANGWMNTPTGITIQNGVVTHFDPFEAMNNPAWLPQSLHMVLAAYASMGFFAAGIHAIGLLKKPENLFHQTGLRVAFWVGAVTIPLQLASGHLSAMHVAQYQPMKLAAMEGQWKTEAGAPLRIFGWPNEKEQRTEFAIEIPKMLSFLAYENPDAVVRGIADFPVDERPPIWPIHVSFQVMIFAGMAMLATALLGVFLHGKKKSFESTPWFLKLLALCSPMGFIAVEAGWMVTEIGRQPWIIWHTMRTSEALTPMPYLQIPFLFFTGLYGILSFIVVYLLRKRVFHVDA